jgi:hypothetical protein
LFNEPDPDQAPARGRTSIRKEGAPNGVLMVRSKIKPEGVADVEAAVKKMLAALDAA